MKRFGSVFLLFAFLLTSFPIAAQTKGRTLNDHLPAKGSFAFARAFSDGASAWITWDADASAGSIAYQVVRLNNYGSELLTSSPIPNSQVARGFHDPDGTVGSLYQIISIDKLGKQTVSEPFSAEYTESLSRVAPGSMEELNPALANDGVLSEQVLNLPSELLQVAKQSRNSNVTMQRFVVSQQGVRFGIKRDGMYRVTRAQLEAAGFDVNSDPAVWQLYSNGVQRSMNVDPAGNYIEFYGKSIDTRESDLAQYYLIVGTTRGLRMATRVARPTNGPVQQRNYDQSYKYKQRTSYIMDILNGSDENVWGSIFTNSGVNIPLNVTGIDTSLPTATFSIKLQGFTTTPHNVNIELNGNVVGSLAGNSYVPFGGEFTIPTTMLSEGANTLNLKTVSSADFVMFDSVDIRYLRRFVAEQDAVKFYTVGTRGATVSNFSTPNIRLFDITNENDPGKVVDLDIVANGTSFDLNLPAYRQKVYYAVADSAIMSPFTIKANNASNLASTNNDGTLIIISHPDLMVQANAWADYRRNQGIVVSVVDVEDIFDEFSFGVSNAAAVTDFLAYAENNWNTPPQYVLLLGDASYDPRNYFNRGYQNMVPTKMVDTLYVETGSDEALADFNNDGLSEIAIGRMPARTPAVAADMLARTIAFEVPAQQNLNRGAVFAYDAPNGFDFQWMSQQLRSQLPDTMPATFVDRLAAGSQQTVVNEMNLGRYLVNYSGHGTTGNWYGASFFGFNNVTGAAGVPQLANPGNRSIFTMLTCLNGYFMNPYNDSLSEMLIKYNNGGASMVWASTGLTTPDVQLVMASRFFNQIGAGSITRAGDLVKDAKTMVPGGLDVRLSWALIGDPMLKVRP